MRILNEDQDGSVDRITLYLTMLEATELRDKIEALIADPLGRHEHIPSDDYRKELTLCIYDLSTIEQFDDRSKRLIIEDI